LVEDHCVHGGGSLGPAIRQLTADCNPDEIQAAAMKDDADMANGEDEAFLGWNDDDDNVEAQPSAPPLPEGRVHGSGLLALLSGRGHVSAASCSDNGASTSSAMRTWM